MRILRRSLFVCFLLLLPISSAWSLPKSATTKHFLSQQRTAVAKRPFNRHTKLQLSNVPTSPVASKMSNNDTPSPYKWSIFALLASAFLNLLGFTMAGPITPALGQHFNLEVGASFGSLTSAYPLGMLFGLFLWPNLSDTLGRPPVMTISLLGTGLGLAAQAYVVASPTKSLSLFLLSRVVTGCFAGSSPVSKAYLADVSGDNLARNLAWRDAASTFAFLMGPLLGGVFLSTSTSLSFVIGVSSIASLLAALVVGILVRDGPPVQARQSKKKNKLDTTKYDTSDLVSCPLGTSLWAGVATVCLISFLFNVGDSTFHAFFSALLKQRNLSPSNIGLAYTSLAAISFTMSATMASRTMKKFGPVPMCAMGLTAVGSGLVAMGLGAAHVWMILAAACFYYCGVPLYSPTIPTMLLRCVPPNRRGFILGLDGAVNTVARIISPLLMGGIYKAKGPKAAFGLAGGTVLFAAMAALVKRLHVLKQHQDEMNAGGGVAPKKA